MHARCVFWLLPLLFVCVLVSFFQDGTTTKQEAEGAAPQET